MIGAQWQNLAFRAQHPMLPLAMDSALLQFRRTLQAAVDAEAAVSAAQPPAAT
jgi:hypothetical protein